MKKPSASVQGTTSGRRSKTQQIRYQPLSTSALFFVSGMSELIVFKKEGSDRLTIAPRKKEARAEGKRCHCVEPPKSRAECEASYSNGNKDSGEHRTQSTRTDGRSYETLFLPLGFRFFETHLGREGEASPND